MALARVSQSPGGRRGGLLGACLASAALVLLAWAGRSACFSMLNPGMSRKQMRGTYHTRGQLPPQVLELPVPEPEAPEPEKETLPERRVPYTMHIVSHYPEHKHLPSEGATVKFIERKLQGALHHVESLVKHVEVHLVVQEHFHKLKTNHKRLSPGAEREESGARAVAPYSLKIIVSLKNHRDVVFANPEKHAQPTLTEAVDTAVDGVRRLMREVKEKEIKKARGMKEQLGADDDGLTVELQELALNDQLEELDERTHVLGSPLADSAMEEFYERVESKIVNAAAEAQVEAKAPAPAPTVAPAPRKAAATAKPTAAAKSAATSLRDFLL